MMIVVPSMSMTEMLGVVVRVGVMMAWLSWVAKARVGGPIQTGTSRALTDLDLPVLNLGEG